MKKMIFVVALLATTIVGVAQTGLLRPVPQNLFSTDKAIKSGNTYSIFVPRINVGLNAVSYGRNPDTKALEISQLNAIMFGLGFLHYKNVDGLPFNDFGFNVAYLQLTNRAGSGVGIYGTYNTGPVGLLNLGAHYDFSVNQVFVDTGVTFHF